MRRDSGEGYIGERMVGGKPAGWVGTFEVAPDPVTGKRRRKAVYSQHPGPGGKREVKQKLAQAMRAHEAAAGQPTTGQDTTGEWLNEWLRTVVAGKQPKTIRGHRGAVAHYLIPRIGKVPLATLSRAQVRSMLSDLYEIPLKTGTVHNIRATLRAALEVARKDGVIASNPAAGRDIETQSVVRKEMTILQPEQRDAFEQAIRGDREETLYLFALQSGWRQGEILGLSWRNVDLEAGTATAVDQLQEIAADMVATVKARGGRVAGPSGKHGSMLVLKAPKTKSTRRSIVLSAGMVEALRAHRARQREERIRLGERWLDRHDLVFTTELGAPLDGPALTRRFQALLKRARLPRLRFHDLRHTCIVWLLNRGLSVFEVADYVGHSTSNQVLSTYGRHVVNSRQTAAATAMESIFARGG